MSCVEEKNKKKKKEKKEMKRWMKMKGKEEK